MTLFTPNTKVGALNHVGIAVLSIEESLQQYQLGQQQRPAESRDGHCNRACRIG